MKNTEDTEDGKAWDNLIGWRYFPIVLIGFGGLVVFNAATLLWKPRRNVVP